MAFHIFYILRVEIQWLKGYALTSATPEPIYPMICKQTFFTKMFAYISHTVKGKVNMYFEIGEYAIRPI